jgi:hypothetical protein
MSIHPHHCFGNDKLISFFLTGLINFQPLSKSFDESLFGDFLRLSTADAAAK